MIFKIIVMVVSIVLSLCVLVQEGPLQGSFGHSFGGSNLSLFAETKERGSTKVFTIITSVLIALFFIVTIATSYIK